ncbi:MAG: ABC transporter ATP-binding protein/permease [Bacilli bacterium]|nr:ABC transporter ATP-binding protein/permease [Bacilli bacterium]
MKNVAVKPVKKYSWRLCAGPAFKLFEVACELIIPFLTKTIIDEFIPSGDMRKTLIYGAIILGLGFFSFFMTMISQYYASRVACDYGYDMKKAVYHKISTLSEKQLDTYGKQKAVTLVNNDTFSLQNAVHMFMRLIFRPPFLIGGAMVMSFIISPYAGIIFSIIMVLCSIVVALLFIFTPKKYAEIQSSLDDINLVASDSLKGARPVRAFNKQEFVEEQFNKATTAYEKKNLGMAALNSILNPATFCFIHLGIVLVVYLGDLSISGASVISTGSIVTLISYLVSSFAALMMFSRMIVALNKARASLKRINQFLLMEPDITNNPEGEPCDSDEYIKFDHVSFSYSDTSAKNTLNDINISIKKDQWIGFIGGTGSGKSTVISLLERMYQVKEGTIYYRGLPIDKYDLDKLRQEISLVSQKPSVFKGTVKSNLVLAKDDATDEEIEWALKQSLAYEYISKYPDYTDHEIEENGANLSGGQRQRLLIARGLLKGGDLLILDDSTSALDYLSDLHVRENISSIPGLTKIIVSQRAGSLKDCDMIYVFDKGEIVGAGTHTELLENCKIYREIYDMQRSQ